VAGRSIARRGKAKHLGGVGRKVTGITKRKFKPNIPVRFAESRSQPKLFVWGLFKSRPSEDTGPLKKQMANETIFSIDTIYSEVGFASLFLL
jgi:hypothetical protein